jgi:hypothetical protein
MGDASPGTGRTGVAPAMLNFLSVRARNAKNDASLYLLGADRYAR